MIGEIRHIAVKIAEELFPLQIAREMTLFIKDNYKESLVGMEIGTQHATNAYNILRLLPIKKLYLIDPYENYDENTEDPNLDVENIRKIANKKMAPFSNVEFIYKYSENASDMFKDEEIDFLYIDGNHNYKYVKSDIELYYPKIKKGGVLGGHDYNPVFPGVSKAVNEFVKKHNLKLYGSNIDWWVVK